MRLRYLPGMVAAVVAATAGLLVAAGPADGVPNRCRAHRCPTTTSSMTTVTSTATSSTTTTVAATTTTAPSMTTTAGIAIGSEIAFASTQAATLQAMVGAGADWIRTDIQWQYLEPAQGEFHWTDRYDPLVSGIVGRGMRMLALLHTVPAWANGGRGDYAPPPNLAEETRYCYQVAQRYIPQGVTAYEVGNEVNLPHPGWTISGSFYVTNLLSPCASGVRRAASEAGVPATVVVGGFAPGDCCGGVSPVTMLGQVYAAGPAAFDAVSYHPYTDSPLTHPNMTTLPGQIHDVMAAHGDAAEQVWGTEYGEPTAGSFSVSESRQAQMVDEAFDVWYGKSFAGPLFWYTARDRRAYGASTNREDFFGLLRLDGSAKPALARYTARVG